MFVWPIVRGWNVHRRYLLEGHTPLREGLRSDVVSFGWPFLCKFSARRWSSLLVVVGGMIRKLGVVVVYFGL